MNATKPTPGQWEVDGFNTASVIAKQENGSYKHVCRCDYGYNPGEFLDINNANARLIAKAPDMLAAIKEFVDRVDRGEIRSTKTYNKFKTIISNVQNEK